MNSLRKQTSDLYLQINAFKAADLTTFAPNVSGEEKLKHKRKPVNPILVATLNNERKKTLRKCNTSQPSWDDVLILPLKHNDHTQILNLTVWDKHKRFKSYLGELRLTITDIFFNKDNKFQNPSELKWYKLYSSDDKHGYIPGSILLSFELCQPSKRARLKLDGLELSINIVSNSHIPVPQVAVIDAGNSTPDLKDSTMVVGRPETVDTSGLLQLPPVATSSTKQNMLISWLKLLNFPNPDQDYYMPNEQGFYEAAITIDDQSDIESVRTTTVEFSHMNLDDRQLYLHGDNSIGNFNGSSLSVNSSTAAAGGGWSGSNSKFLSVRRIATAEKDASSNFASDSDVSTIYTETSSIALSRTPSGSSFHSGPVKKPLRRSRLGFSKASTDKTDEPFRISKRDVYGVVFLEIVSCSDLPPYRNFTRTTYDIDPFVVVTFGKKTFRTSWKRHTLNPVFHERMAFEILSSERNYDIQFSVLDKDHFSFHDMIANVTLPMKDILKVATVKNELSTPDSSSANVSLSDFDSTYEIDHPIIKVIDDSETPKTKPMKQSKRNRLSLKHKSSLSDKNANASKLRTMNLDLQVFREKYADSSQPKLKIGARFETYHSLTRRFWEILLDQFLLNESKTYDYIELISLLDTLGCKNSDSIVGKFFADYDKTPWSGDSLTYDQIIESVQTHINNEGEGDNESLRIFEIERCPICCQKRLSKKQDIDIVTHVAICASKDWSIVSKFLVASYVTPQIATRKWFLKIVMKVSYGKYQLGSHSANILVQDRTTGIILEEKMSVYVRMGIRLLYNGVDLSKSKHFRILLKKLTVKQGAKFDSPELKEDIPSFIKFHKLDLSDCLEDDYQKYATFNDFFYRRLKSDARPNEGDSNIIVSPADCRCTAFGTVNDATEFWIKGRNFSVIKLFNGHFQDIANDSNYSLGIFRLAPQDYHRFHCPVKGRIRSIKHIDGEYYTVNPMAIRSKLDVYGENVRSIIVIDTEKFGTVVYACIGAMMVGSIVLSVEEGTEVDRGDEIGYFKFGGSTILLLFDKTRFKFDQDLVHNLELSVETLIRVGQSIGHHKSVPSLKRERLDFSKQSEDFKMKLIRVITGGDLKDSKELSNWESRNMSITRQDLDTAFDNIDYGEENEEDDDDQCLLKSLT